ncbi:MAG: hypothetical protein AAF267_05445 [Deinococcota bacterium]
MNLRRLLIALLTLAITSTTFAQTTPSYPLESLSLGQTGYAVTASSGNVLERFPVEVLGVQYDNADFPLVLIRASGPFIDQTDGIASGMSGSPVYLSLNGQDALLGAICCTFPSSEPGLALVTPIEVMRRADPDERLSLQPAAQQLHQLAWGRQVPLEDAVPVSTPLLFTGLSPRASELLEPLFESSSMTPFPVQSIGLGSTEAADANFRLEPGISISVQLVRGDITIAALGTVTAIEGDNIYAFGHPLLGDGNVAFAFAPAHVSYIVPNDNVSFKLANNGQRVLGSITQDRPYAISGNIGEIPRYLPVTLTLSEGLSNESATPGEAAPPVSTNTITKRFEMVSDERYYPALMASATLDAFDEVLEQNTSGNAELTWDITLGDGQVVTVQEQITSASDIARASARLAAEPLAILAGNIFAPPDIARVQVNVRYSTRQSYGDIVQVVTEQGDIGPGDLVTAFVRLQPYRNQPEVKTLRFRIPEDIEDDDLELIFRGGLEPATRGDTRPRRTDRDTDGEDQFTDKILSFQELLIALQQNVQATELVVETIIDGDVERLERLPLPYLVSGVETVRIDIQQDDAQDDAQDDVEEDDNAIEDPATEASPSN